MPKRKINGKYVDEKYITLVAAKLKAEGLSINSDWQDIVNCLSKTVQPDFCIAAARELRKQLKDG